MKLMETGDDHPRGKYDGGQLRPGRRPWVRSRPRGGRHALRRRRLVGPVRGRRRRLDLGSGTGDVDGLSLNSPRASKQLSERDASSFSASFSTGTLLFHDVSSHGKQLSDSMYSFEHHGLFFLTVGVQHRVACLTASFLILFLTRTTINVAYKDVFLRHTCQRLSLGSRHIREV